MSEVIGSGSALRSQESCGAAMALREVVADEKAPLIASTDSFQKVVSKPFVKSKIARVEFDAQALEKRLEPGDIISVQLRPRLGAHKLNPFDRAIGVAQKVAQLWTKGKREPHHEWNIHVAFYLGNGDIAESTNTGTIIVPLFHHAWRLQPEDAMQYKVTRMKDKHLASCAVDLAYACAAKRYLDEPLKHGYSVSLALNSLLHNSNFGFQAKQRVLENYAQTKPAAHDFFCTYFIGWALQKAESQQLVDEELTKKPSLAPPNNSVNIKGWAKKSARKNAELLERMTLRFDSKHLSPQKLRTIMLENPEIFEDVLTVVPPKKT